MKENLSRSKGQSVSIDWLTGLSLFMVAIISATLLVVNDSAASQSGLSSQAEEISQNIREETQLTARKVPLYVRGPHEVGKIPVDTEYDFPVDANSAVLDIPADINESGNSIVTVVETGRRTHNMAYFFESLEEANYDNDIEENGQRIENTHISFVPSNIGLDSLRTPDDREILDSNGAEFEDASTTYIEDELHAEVGDLKIYNGSKELILEDAQASFHLRNFTDLYWGEDGNIYDLVGNGNIKAGETSGLTLATLDGTDYGVTFTGDLEANVTKPENDRIRVDINGSRVRIMPHDTDHTSGQERIEFHDDGGIYFGAESQVSGIHPDKITGMENMIDIAFENRFDLRDYSYNITLLNMERGSPIPFQDVVVHNREAAIIGRYGNFSNTTIEVRLWR